MRVFLTMVLSALVGNGVGPGEQIIQEACVRITHVLGNLREQVLEIIIRLQTICLRCLHDAVDRGAGLGAVNGVKDTPIVAAYAERSDCALTGGVIYGNAAVLQIHFQILLLVHTGAQARSGVLRDHRLRVNRFYPRKIGLRQRLRVLLAAVIPFFRASVPSIRPPTHRGTRSGPRPGTRRIS